MRERRREVCESGEERGTRGKREGFEWERDGNSPQAQNRPPRLSTKSESASRRRMNPGTAAEELINEGEQTNENGAKKNISTSFVVLWWPSDDGETRK